MAALGKARLAGAAASFGAERNCRLGIPRFRRPFTEFFTRPAWLAVLAFCYCSSSSALPTGSRPPPATLEISVLTKAFGGAASFVGFVAGAMAVYARGPLPGLVFAASLLLLSNAWRSWCSTGPRPSPSGSVWPLGPGGWETASGPSPVAAYAMGLCRPSYTATQFALFSAVMAFAQMAPGPRSWLAELMGERLDDMFLSVTLASLLSLLLLRVLWKRQRREETRS